jgi:uncharacterized membrane protein
MFVFVLVTLEVRQFFQGEFLDAPGRLREEMMAYSLTWAALGAVFLIVGILRRSLLFRWASLIIMLITVVKVFIFDLADLRDLWRVVSFTGLGVSLMVLAFIYQRFIFRLKNSTGPSVQATASPSAGDAPTPDTAI